MINVPVRRRVKLELELLQVEIDIPRNSFHSPFDVAGFLEANGVSTESCGATVDRTRHGINSILLGPGRFLNVSIGFVNFPLLQRPSSESKASVPSFISTSPSSDSYFPVFSPRIAQRRSHEAYRRMRLVSRPTLLRNLRRMHAEHLYRATVILTWREYTIH